MQIPLKHFEEYIDETILKRGLSYFKKGLVHQPEEVRPGQYETIVEGTEDYSVSLTIEGGVITKYACDCPYDMGPVCKHVTSVIFYLQQDELGLSQNKKRGKSPSPKSPKRTTFSQQVNELLSKATHDELKQFIRERASADTSFRDLFLVSFAQYNSSESKELYAKQIKSILKKAARKYGFIDRTTARSVRKEIDRFLDSAQRQIDGGNYTSGFLICSSIMEEMGGALLHSDDSNGDIGEPISSAYNMLCTIAEEQPSERLRQQIFEYCMTSFEKRVFDGWDWHTDLLSLAANLAETDDEIERLKRQIESVPTADDFDQERAQEIMYDLLLKTQGEDVAQQYLEQNITNPIFRERAIQRAMDEKNYTKAIELANDGVAQDSEKSLSLIAKWYDWLLKIAQIQGDTKQIIRYARFSLKCNFSVDSSYYQILKETIPSKQWSEVVESFVQHFSERGYFGRGIVASIFIKEEWWDRLLALVKEYDSLSFTEDYETYLAEHRPDELVKIYADGILDSLEYNMGRDYYENACRYIRKMIKLGARARADEVIRKLRSAYPRRRALMEELEKI